MEHALLTQAIVDGQPFAKVFVPDDSVPEFSHVMVGLLGPPDAGKTHVVGGVTSEKLKLPFWTPRRRRLGPKSFALFIVIRSFSALRDSFVAIVVPLSVD